MSLKSRLNIQNRMTPAPNTINILSPSSLMLIAANLLPVAASVFLDWNLSDVMLLYWAESAVIGFFNLARMGVIGKLSALFSGVFFVVHFGLFMAGHLQFLIALFIQPELAADSANQGIPPLRDLIIPLWPALMALFISHGFSFFQNFLGRQEYLERTVAGQMMEPYGRIIFMHIALLAGGGLSMMLGGSTPVLLLIIVFKIAFDIRAHLKQHNARSINKTTEKTGQ